MFCIADVLTAAQLQEIRTLLAEQPFQSGSRTAGWAATLVKNNEQLAPDASHYEKLQELIVAALSANEVFALAAMPKALRPIIFSRYTTGMGYGDHVDNALMGEQTRLRSDLSFTLFLSAPDEYGGGELMIEDTQGTHAYKLDAGALVLYPSDTLHRVETVTAGVRQVAVGWVQCSRSAPAADSFRSRSRTAAAVSTARQDAAVRLAVEVLFQPLASVGGTVASRPSGTDGRDATNGYSAIDFPFSSFMPLPSILPRASNNARSSSRMVR